MSDELRVTISDVRAAGFCVRGARRWFESHGLEFRRFLAEGERADVLVALRDGYADRAVEAAMKRSKERGINPE